MYNLALKMAISASITLIIGNVLGLDYATVGAVIAILSIQDTRRQALIVGKKRVVACLIGILISIIWNIRTRTNNIWDIFISSNTNNL